jgi:hypothetical protein
MKTLLKDLALLIQLLTFWTVSIVLFFYLKTGRKIMSRKAIIVLIYHLHKLSRLVIPTACAVHT